MSLSIEKLQKISISSYKFLTDYLPIILFEKNSNFLHNKIMSKNYSELTNETFEGKLSCGGACYLLNYYLKLNDIETRLIKKKIGSGDYLEDHCYLIYKNKMIIDPTWRQFFTDCITKSDHYTNSLFKKYPFVFVGSIQDLRRQYEDLNCLYKNYYNKKLEVEICDFWENGSDYSEILDAKKVFENKKYAKEKGKIFLQLYNNYNYNSKYLVDT